ncbi:MAG: hypothetical protein DRN21_02055 [Thermoplasmata archaeon]|nr:MAG: hypothetical protein DRN21_02055 [Thermoplasmata archaeon]HDN50400.1 hypothetical protein [Thermoplasmatales archaeon]
MDVRKKVLLVGIAVAVLSAAVATQYARITIGYEFSVVHPSDGMIRFVALDNASDGSRVLRVRNNGTTATMNLSFGDIPKGMNKTYSAAFAIVNEEPFEVNITGVTVTGSESDAVRIWLHSDADTDATGDTSVMLWNGAALSGYWRLAAGNGDETDMDGAGTSTPWDTNDFIRYAAGTPTAVSGTDDFVWVQISIDTNDVAAKGDYTGTIEFQFEAQT